MISLFFVGDGPRDEATAPRLVERILGVNVQAHFSRWSDMRVNGNARKVLFAARIAREHGAVGLVATVDMDKAARRERLRDLQEGREKDRSKANYPIALGEAVPHGEAWLLDDPVAVRRVLRLEAASKVPTVRQTKDPKQTIEDLRRQGERGEDGIIVVLTEIAQALEVRRCVHAQETGFGPFVDEVRSEFGGLASACSPGCLCGDQCEGEGEDEDEDEGEDEVEHARRRDQGPRGHYVFADAGTEVLPLPRGFLAR